MLSLKTIKGVVTLKWESPTMEASWKIRPSMTEVEMLETLERVTQFVRAQYGQAPMAMGMLRTNSPTSLTTTTVSATSAGTASIPQGEPGKILMAPAAALSELPAGGLPPVNKEFWESMPTLEVPGNLAPSWEMDPDAGSGW